MLTYFWQYSVAVLGKKRYYLEQLQAFNFPKYYCSLPPSKYSACSMQIWNVKKNDKNSTTSQSAWLWCMNLKKMPNITLWDTVGTFFSIVFCKRLQISYHSKVFFKWNTKIGTYQCLVGPGKVSAFFCANTDNIAWKQLCYIIHDHHHLKVANIIKNKQKGKMLLIYKKYTIFFL